MAVLYSSNRVIVTAYKSGTTTATSTTNLQITSGEIVAGDIGRMVAVIPAGGNSGDVQVRTITGVSGGTISIHDPWVGSIASGTSWRVSHNLEDVHAIGNAALQKTGDRTYRWDADWDVTSTGFLADEDISLEMQKNNTTSYPIAAGGIVQFGRLYGGEGTGFETTGGGRIRLRALANNSNIYSSTNARVANGGVTNYFGCLVHSQPTGWMFQRMTGPARFIGCNFDGPMGGRFYHEASEWVQCRMTGNDNTTPAWSIGATFDRDIADIFSYYNLRSMKSYLDFGGTLRNVTFANNTSIFGADGNGGSLFNFIDSTEFGAAEAPGSGGIIRQFRSVVLKTTDDSGANLADVNVRINDVNDTTEGSVETSDANGDVNEILALRIQKLHGSTTYTNFAPFRMRLRKYGFVWPSLNTSIADPIKQSIALVANAFVTQSSGTAAAHTGITLTDHGGSPVSWNGKNWGITVTGNLTTNPSLTSEDIKHYLHYNLSLSAAFQSKASGLHWHELIPMSGTETQRGLYGATNKGVRVVDENGDPFPGFTRFQADDGTFYTPPLTVPIVITVVDTSGTPIQGARVYVEAGATGPATQGDVILNDLTDVNGVVQDAGYVFTGDQSLQNGRVRKSSTPPLYKAANFSGTITSSGFETTVTMVSDT